MRCKHVGSASRHWLNGVTFQLHAPKQKAGPREQSTHVSPPGEPAFGFKLRQASGLRFSSGIPMHLCYPSGFAERRCQPATLLHTGARKPRALTLYEPTASSGRYFEPAPRHTDEHGVSSQIQEKMWEVHFDASSGRGEKCRARLYFREQGAVLFAQPGGYYTYTE